MKPSIFFEHIFQGDPHLRYGPGLYFTEDGRPTYSGAGDLLSIFIVQELFEASETNDWKDIIGFQTFSLSVLVPAAEEIKGAISAIGSLLTDALDHNVGLGLPQVFSILDQYYPDGFTTNYHDDEGRPTNLTEPGDTLAKWLITQAADIFGELPSNSTHGQKLIALTNLMTSYAKGLNRIYVICGFIDTL
jgi:hypothetical protein